MTENNEDIGSMSKKIKLEHSSDVHDAVAPHCHFLVKKKNRFCKMTVKEGNQYCGEHSMIESDNRVNERIPCPLDSKHTVEVKNLEKHLKKCNARDPETLPAFISKNCNLFDSVDDSLETEESDVKLQDVPQHQLSKIIKKVEKLFAEFVEDKIVSNFRSHDALAEELSNESYGDEKRKHLLQASSILGIMQNENLFIPRTCFIEYGAGKAALTFWLAQAIENLPSSKILVVDRASHRHKKDNLVKDKEKIERIRADIADLKLSGISTVVEQDHFIGISKHLCGVATDLTLRCIVNGNREMTKKTRHVLICVCCHHRCIWRSFAGKEWLITNDIDEYTFKVITRMVSWCVCGDRGQSKSNHERELIGWKCKRLLDYARLQYLIENRYEAKLYYYVEKSVTPENVCIFAKLKDVNSDNS